MNRLFPTILCSIGIAMMLIGGCSAESNSTNAETSSSATVEASAAKEISEIDEALNLYKSTEYKEFSDYVDWYIGGMKSKEIDLADIEQMKTISETFAKLNEAMPEYQGESKRVKTLYEHLHGMSSSITVATMNYYLGALEAANGNDSKAAEYVKQGNDASTTFGNAETKFAETLNDIRLNGTI